MPVLKEEDARMVTQAILAMRGVNQKRHKSQHEEGNLKLQYRPMAYKGTATAWMRCLDLGEQEDWLQEPAILDGPTMEKETLKNITCPKCCCQKNVDKCKVYGKVGFSRITCMGCKITTTAQEWKCGCNTSWQQNCEKHTLETLMHAIRRGKVEPGRGKLVRRDTKQSLQGQDKAFPTRRCLGNKEAILSRIPEEEQPRTMLKAGSILASRFPKLYALQLKGTAS